jgi:hypothetical protein
MIDDKNAIILNLTWGKIEVQVSGTTHHFKDCMIWPTGALEWDWQVTGTSHALGIQVDDVKALIEKGAEEIILSRGQLNRLTVARETREYLDKNSITYYVETTGRAAERFNELAGEGVAVGGLFHTTC